MICFEVSDTVQSETQTLFPWLVRTLFPWLRALTFKLQRSRPLSGLQECHVSSVGNLYDRRIIPSSTSGIGEEEKEQEKVTNGQFLLIGRYLNKWPINRRISCWKKSNKIQKYWYSKLKLFISTSHILGFIFETVELMHSISCKVKYGKYSINYYKVEYGNYMPPSTSLTRSRWKGLSVERQTI